MKISYFEFGTDDTIRIKAIPVRRNSDGAYGMYNLMNNTFYGSSGTNTLTPGPEVINQNHAIPGMTWTATWTANANNSIAAGTVSGVARCTSVAGDNDYQTDNPTKFSQLTAANQTAWNTPFTSSTVSNYYQCWCKMTGINAGGENIDPASASDWVFEDNLATMATCTSTCASTCATRVSGTATYRKALFGQ